MLWTRFQALSGILWVLSKNGFSQIGLLQTCQCPFFNGDPRLDWHRFEKRIAVLSFRYLFKGCLSAFLLCKKMPLHTWKIGFEQNKFYINSRNGEFSLLHWCETVKSRSDMWCLREYVDKTDLQTTKFNPPEISTSIRKSTVIFCTSLTYIYIFSVTNTYLQLIHDLIEVFYLFCRSN